MIELHNFLLCLAVEFSVRKTAFGDVQNEDQNNADEEDEDEEKDLNEDPHDFGGFADVKIFPLDAVGLHETGFEFELLCFEDEVFFVFVFEVWVLFLVEFEHLFS